MLLLKTGTELWLDCNSKLHQYVEIYNKLQGSTAPDEFVLFISQNKPILYQPLTLEMENIKKNNKVDTTSHYLSLKNVF